MAALVINDTALEYATRELFIGLTDQGDLNARQFHALKEIARQTIITYLGAQTVPEAVLRGPSVLIDGGERF